MENKTFELLNNKNIPYKEYHHESCLNYEVAHKIDEELHISGQEAKALLMKGKKTGLYYCFLTIEGTRVDQKYVKELVNEKVSLVPAEEIEDVFKEVVGCVSPFGYDENLVYLVDEKCYSFEELIYAAGIDTCSFTIKGEDLKRLLELLPNKKIIY